MRRALLALFTLALTTSDATAQDGDAGSESGGEATVAAAPSANDKAGLATASAYRTQVYESLPGRLDKVLTEGDASNTKLRQIFKTWMGVGPDDAGFADAVMKVRAVYAAAKSATATVILPPDSISPCNQFDEKMNSPNSNAWFSAGTIYLCKSWSDGDAACQRVVLFHEYLHAANLTDVQGINPSSSLADKLRDASYMAGLATQLYSQADSSDRCDGGTDVALPVLPY